MAKIFFLIAIMFVTGCTSNDGAEKYGDVTKEVVYDGGSTNISNTRLLKITVDSVVYIVAIRREGIAIIKHGTVTDTLIK